MLNPPGMTFRLLPLILLLSCACALFAQQEAPSHHEIYGGYTFLSNSFNGVPGSRQPLNGWDASVVLNAWRGVRFKAETFGYTGTNLGAPQSPVFILAGCQFARRLGRESVFFEGLAGDVGMNRD